MLELKEHVYSLTFHPNFISNRFIYFGVNGPSNGKGKHTKILRYTFDAEAKRVCRSHGWSSSSGRAMVITAATARSARTG